ncbi:TRAP transporter substrate-binding protein [Dinoroseobacter sp. S124A]|uniref:TRAP transporter substrate-binding protein n=1 Tax=Dinoroseobacter sp. S124A TaxID=3415128 RepID=UPI003C7C29BC
MTSSIPHDPPAGMDRRAFLRLVSRYGFTAAAVATASGAYMSSAALAQSVSEERERKAAAEHTMIVATPYVLGASRSVPLMQLDFKENIQNMTNGKVYVRLAPGGELGVGSSLAQSVQSNTIQAAQHSLANFAPFAPIVDLVNIPYWCGKNQQAVNLVNSKQWADLVNPSIEARGFKALWYVTIDPRTIALRRGFDQPIRTPDDLAGVKMRIPGSEILSQLYRLLGANPTPIAWGETPSAITQGVADALDPSVQGLQIFGFDAILSWVTFAQTVPNTQVYSCNLDWFNALPGDVQEGILFASEVTAHQNLSKVPAARAFSMWDLSQAGVQFYVPNDDEMGEWVARGGHQLPDWDPFKIELAGSIANFETLNEAANTRGKYVVHDV